MTSPGDLTSYMYLKFEIMVGYSPSNKHGLLISLFLDIFSNLIIGIDVGVIEPDMLFFLESLLLIFYPFFSEHFLEVLHH